MKRGLFITFEGIEGSGKSTHAGNIAAFLRKQGADVLLIREPGCTKIGEKIRRIILNKKNIEMCVETELLLYNAARAQLVVEVISPALKSNKIVICDRFIDSTLAYQAYGGGLDFKEVNKISCFAAKDIQPDLTFLLDSDVKRGLERAGRGDRMELKSLAFHKRVRKGFLLMAKANPKRIIKIKEMPIEKGEIIIRDWLSRIM